MLQKKNMPVIFRCSIIVTTFTIRDREKGQIMERRDKAAALLKELHHCAQAVLCAYADELDVSEETMKRFAASFGGGMATMEGNCGALIGAAMVLGLKKYQGKRIHHETVQLYRLLKMMLHCAASCAFFWKAKGIRWWRRRTMRIWQQR